MLKIKFSNSSCNKAGFSLVELIVYMGILSALLVVFTDIFTSILDNELSSQRTSSVAQDGRYIYSRLIYDINRAQGIVLPANLGDTSVSLQAVIAGKLYTYALSNGNLTITDDTGTSYMLNSYDTTISGLQFTRLGNATGKHTFRINFDVTGKILMHGTTEVKSFQTTAGLR